MRIVMLASLVAVSAVVTLLVASGAAAAAPAGAAAKRASRRPATASSAEAPRPLPAPLPKGDVLPPLPPVTRDVTAMTTVTSAAVPEWTSGASGGSGAGAAASLPALSPSEPPARPAAAAPVNPDVATAEADPVRGAKPSGWVLRLGTGVLAPASSFVPGVGTLGAGALFDIELGYYATPHFGMLVGVRGSYGHTFPGCSGSCDEGYSYQVPVMFQLAAKDRTRGVYVDVGLGFATTYGGNAGSGVTYTLTSPVEGKVGLGYRFGSAGAARSSTSFDLGFGMDIGSIDKLEVKTAGGGKTSSGSGDAPTHVVVALSAVMHFSL